MFSLDKTLGINWIKYGLPLLALVIAITWLFNWDKNRLIEAGNKAVDKVEIETIRENQQDADKLNRQRRAIDNAPDLIDRLLPVETASPDNRENRQDGITERDPSDAATHSANLPRLEGYYQLGTGNELPFDDLFWRAYSELLPEGVIENDPCLGNP